MKQRFIFVAGGFALFCFSTSTVDAQEITVARAPAAIQPQRLAPPTAAFVQNVNPQFFVNTRQARLRDHHLVKAPPIQPTLAPQVDLTPAAIGAQTSVIGPGVAGSPIAMLPARTLSGSETNNITSTVLEPTVAVSLDGTVLYTGNWFAAISKDKGQTFSYRNPFDVFSGGGSSGFCCDQVVFYEPTRDIMFWYLQGVQDGSSNTGRLVFAKGADIRNENWQYYDLTPANVGGFTNEWFDFPDLAVSSRYLYVSTNSFDTKGTTISEDDSFARAFAIRLDLDQIAAGGAITPEFFSSTEAFSLRPTHGATDTMHFGSHDFAQFERGILVFSWPDNSATVSRRAVQVDRWSNAPRDSVARDGNQWLRRSDFRMTAAWVIGREAGFAWSAAGVSPFRHPHIRVAIINMAAAAATPVRQPHLWNDQYAFAYPAVYGTSAGSSAGVAVQYGGGGQLGLNPSHAVGALKRAPDGSYSWILQRTIEGTNGPSDGRWGDYMAVRPTDGGGWVSSGYTLQGGSLPTNVVPLIAFFNEGGVPAPASASASNIRGELEQLRTRIDSVLQQLGGAGATR